MRDKVSSIVMYEDSSLFDTFVLRFFPFSSKMMHLFPIIETMKYGKDMKSLMVNPDGIGCIMVNLGVMKTSN